MTELSSEIYLQEHRNRYQLEQSNRLVSSKKHFDNYFYKNSTCTIGDFVLDYSKFLWNEISNSHGGYSNKIAYNLVGNYHSSISSVDKLIYHLYFQKSYIKRVLGSLLKAAYRNPTKLQQNSLV